MFYTLINHQYKFIVFWNPKCGCTTLKNWFYKLACAIEDKEVEKSILKNPQRIHRILKINQHSYFVSHSDVLNKYQEYKKLIVTRNPYERVVSYYCNKIINRQSHLVLAGKMTNKNCQLHFHDFCLLLKKQRKKFSLEHHAKPQFYGLHDIHFDFIIDLKELNNLLPLIHNELGIENDYPFLELMGDNASNKKYNPTKYDFSLKKKVSHLKPKKFKKIPHYTYFYDDTSQQIILDIYLKDFNHFGYSHKLGNQTVSIPKKYPLMDKIKNNFIKQINLQSNTIINHSHSSDSNYNNSTKNIHLDTNPDHTFSSTLGSSENCTTVDILNHLDKAPTVSIFSSSQEIPE